MCRVTIVDYEPNLLELICDCLHDEGHEVTGIGHANVAVGLPLSPRPDLFLLDLMLPGMSGVQLAHELQTHGFADTPMIAISASVGMLQQADSSGLFHATLAKPFDLDALIGC